MFVTKKLQSRRDGNKAPVRVGAPAQAVGGRRYRADGLLFGCGSDGVADFVEGFGVVVDGGFAAVVDDCDGLAFEVGVDALGAFDEADV